MGKHADEIRAKVVRRDAARKHVLAYDTVETAWTNLVRDSNADIHFLLSELYRKDAALTEMDEILFAIDLTDDKQATLMLKRMTDLTHAALAEQEEA